VALYIFKIVVLITSFIFKTFSNAKFNANLIIYIKFRISLGLERLVNYAGEFQRKKPSLIF